MGVDLKGLGDILLFGFVRGTVAGPQELCLRRLGFPVPSLWAQACGPKPLRIGFSRLKPPGLSRLPGLSLGMIFSSLRDCGAG